MAERAGRVARMTMQTQERGIMSGLKILLGLVVIVATHCLAAEVEPSAEFLITENERAAAVFDNFTMQMSTYVRRQGADRFLPVAICQIARRGQEYRKDIEPALLNGKPTTRLQAGTNVVNEHYFASWTPKKENAAIAMYDHKQFRPGNSVEIARWEATIADNPLAISAGTPTKTLRQIGNDPHSNWAMKRLDSGAYQLDRNESAEGNLATSISFELSKSDDFLISKLVGFSAGHPTIEYKISYQMVGNGVYFPRELIRSSILKDGKYGEQLKYVFDNIVLRPAFPEGYFTLANLGVKEGHLIQRFSEAGEAKLVNYYQGKLVPNEIYHAVTSKIPDADSTGTQKTDVDLDAFGAPDPAKGGFKFTGRTVGVAVVAVITLIAVLFLRIKRQNRRTAPFSETQGD